MSLVDAETANLALQLRKNWHILFVRRMKAPGEPYSQVKITYIYLDCISCTL